MYKRESKVRCLNLQSVRVHGKSAKDDVRKNSREVVRMPRESLMVFNTGSRESAPELKDRTRNKQ